MKSTSSLLISAAVVLLLNGCSKGSDAPQELVGKHDANAASCLYDFTEGENAPSALPLANKIKAAFDKPYDLSLLEAVGSASGSEVVRFSRLTDVTFYKVDKRRHKTIGCLFTGTLPNALASVEDQFREIEKDVEKEDKDSSLLGIYIPSETVQLVTSFASSENMIVVLNDSEKYTMVHEFMHHLFNLGKAEKGSAVKNRFSNSYKAFEDAEKKFEANENATNMIDVSSKLERAVVDFIAVLSHFNLEEVALETEMYKLHSKGKLKYVSQDSRANGDWYITSSGASTKSLIKQSELGDKALKLSVKANMMGLSSSDKAEVLAKIDSSSKLLSALNTELDKLIREAQQRLNRHKSSRKHLSGLVAEQSHSAKCSRTHEAEKFFSEVLKK